MVAYPESVKSRISPVQEFQYSKGPWVQVLSFASLEMEDSDGALWGVDPPSIGLA